MNTLRTHTGACALAELSVAHNSLGDATATALGSVPSLTKLNLFNTKLGAAGKTTTDWHARYGVVTPSIAASHQVCRHWFLLAPSSA